jgi:hypothetical protein
MMKKVVAVLAALMGLLATSVDALMNIFRK